MKTNFELELKDINGKVPGLCPYCENRKLERLQYGQWGCKDCRIVFMLSHINNEEMIEWFGD